MKTPLAIVVAVTAVTILALCEVGHAANCTTFSSLEHTFAQTEDNLYKTWVTFYPSLDPLPHFVTVTYDFQGTVSTYFWTEASIFLMQPPSVFGFTSLFLAFVRDDRIKEVTLRLPSECDHLARQHSKKDSENLLRVLTHRVSS